MKLVTFVLLIGFSVLVLVVGTPHLEQSRQEARLAQAYIQAKQIKAGTLPIETVDPWGTPFRITKDEHGQIVAVASFGPDQSTVARTIDADDVVSELSAPPRTIMRGKQLQLLATLLLAASPWLLLLGWIILSVLRRSRQAASHSPAVQPLIHS